MQSRTLRNRLGWIAIGAILLLLAIGLLVNQYLQKQSIKESVSQRVDSVTALAFYSERELLRLQRELAVQLAKPDGLDLERLQLRYDIFLSGIAWLRNSPSMAALAQRPQYYELLPKLDVLVKNANAILNRAEPDAQELHSLLEQINAMQIDLMALSSAASSVESRQYESVAEKMLTQSNLILSLAALQIVMLLLAIVALVLRQRQQRAEQIAMKQLNAELQAERVKADAASQAKSQFLANMSHELRTPFNGILGMLRVLQSTGLNARQEDCAAMMGRATRSLLALINDILDFSKVEAGKMELHPQPFYLDRLLLDITDVLRAASNADSVAVRLDIDPALTQPLSGDAMRLQQVLINLGSNAVKFTSQGQVLISARCRPPAEGQAVDCKVVEFSVRDTGIGIAPEHQAHIFTGFSQAEASTTRKYGGTGLGLAISKRLVELMGGQLQLQSEPGHGSVFSFALALPEATELPVAAVPPHESLVAPVQAPAQLAAAQASHGRLAGLRILLVEDNPLNQKVANELLTMEGARITIADNGQLAVDAVLGGAAFDVVLMDLQMPVMDGYEATRMLRSRYSAEQLPIIAMTANAMHSDREACLAAGMNDHVGKPFELDKLVSLLLHTLGRALPEPRVSAPEHSGSAEPVPVVQGLDLEAALRRMSGVRSLYVRTARDFQQSLSGLLAQVRALHGNAEQSVLRITLHTFKGNAATVGATALAQQLADLERRYKADPTADLTPDFDALGPVVLSTMDSLAQAVELLQEPADTHAASALQADPKAAALLLQALCDLLQANDMDALMHYAQCRAQLAACFDTLCESLDVAMQSLDMEQAHAMCQAQLKRMAA